MIAGLSTGLADVASVKVIFFCFDFTGERCSSPSSSAASSSELPCIISMRWELIDGSALSSFICNGGDTTVASSIVEACSLRCSASAIFHSSSSCFLSASRFFFSSDLLSCPFSICSLTGIRLWSQICDHFYFELRDCLITFPIFVPSQRLITRNVHELFSYNRDASHLNEACCVDELSRGTNLGYKILIGFGFGLP